MTVIIVKILKKWMGLPTFLKDLPYSEFKKLADLEHNHLLLANQIWEEILPKVGKQYYSYSTAVTSFYFLL